MFEFEAYEVLKTKEFTVVNDCFQNEYNEKIGHYGQTLFSSHKSCHSKRCTGLIEVAQGTQGKKSRTEASVDNR